MTNPPPELLEVIDHFESLGIEYMLVGSQAGWLQGITRTPVDADLVADLKVHQLPPLLTRLQKKFHLSPSAAQEAVQGQTMFTVLHLSSRFKLDIYLLGQTAFGQHQFHRRCMPQNSTRSLWVATPEDLILNNLHHFQIGNELPQRQLGDASHLLQIHRPTLDTNYLQEWAQKLNLTALWARLQSTRYQPADPNPPQDEDEDEDEDLARKLLTRINNITFDTHKDKLLASGRIAHALSLLLGANRQPPPSSRGPGRSGDSPPSAGPGIGVPQHPRPPRGGWPEQKAPPKE